MRQNSLRGRLVHLLVGLVMLLGAGAGCSPTFGDAAWSTAETEEGIEAIIEHAGTDRAVFVLKDPDVLVAAMVTEPRAIEFVSWSTHQAGATTVSSAPHGVTLSPVILPWTEPFSLTELDVTAIMEREPCDQEYFTFQQTAVDLDDTHTYLETRCTHREEMTAPAVAFHHYLDGEPIRDLDLTDPAALAAVADRAHDAIGAPEELMMVTLAYSEDTRQLDFHYTTRIDETTSITNDPCPSAIYRWTSGVDGESPGVGTVCQPDVTYVSTVDESFAATDFDPAVMTELWREEVGDAEPNTEPTIQLAVAKTGTPVYVVFDGSDHAYFDVEGDPVDLGW